MAATAATSKAEPAESATDSATFSWSGRLFRRSSRFRPEPRTRPAGRRRADGDDGRTVGALPPLPWQQGLRLRRVPYCRGPALHLRQLQPLPRRRRPSGHYRGREEDPAESDSASPAGQPHAAKEETVEGRRRREIKTCRVTTRLTVESFFCK